MYLSANCPRCKMSYRIGDLEYLPQPSRLTAVLGDILHDHKCDAKNLDRLQLSA
jgi:hypothetical protein